ncbi:MAG: MFS transporter [Planctomycetota bacterium]
MIAWPPIDPAGRNFRLFLGFRATTRAILFAPYIFHFMTAVRHVTVEQYGILQAIYYITVVAAEVPSGVLADRIGRRATLVAGALLNSAACFVFAAAPGFWQFAAGEALFALGTASISGADSALLYDSLAARQRQSEYPRAEGAAQAVWLGATALGYPVADLLLVRAHAGVEDPVLTYWVTGGLNLVGVACALAMREPPVQRRLSTREITRGAIRDVIGIPGILRVIAYSVGVFLLLRAAVVSFFNPVLDACFVPVDSFGLVLAATNVIGAAAVYLMPRLLRRYGERPCLVVVPLSLVLMFGLLIPLRTPPAAALFCIQGAMFGVYPVLIRTMLNRLVPSAERRATILSIESMVCRVAFALAAVYAGWALGALGLGAALGTTALVACLPFLFLPLLSRAGRERRRPPPV